MIKYFNKPEFPSDVKRADYGDWVAERRCRIRTKAKQNKHPKPEKLVFTEKDRAFARAASAMWIRGGRDRDGNMFVPPVTILKRGYHYPRRAA